MASRKAGRKWPALAALAFLLLAGPALTAEQAFRIDPPAQDLPAAEMQSASIVLAGVLLCPADAPAAPGHSCAPGEGAVFS
mgnify:CR=1 FL=1